MGGVRPSDQSYSRIDREQNYNSQATWPSLNSHIAKLPWVYKRNPNNTCVIKSVVTMVIAQLCCETIKPSLGSSSRD